MSTQLRNLPGDESLAQLKELIRSKEENGFELITLAQGQLQNQDVNFATFRILAPGTDPGELTLVEIPKALSLAAQDAALVAGAQGGKRLISYAGTFVEGEEKNVAAYRG